MARFLGGYLEKNQKRIPVTASFFDNRFVITYLTVAIWAINSNTLFE